MGRDGGVGERLAYRAREAYLPPTPISPLIS